MGFQSRGAALAPQTLPQAHHVIGIAAAVLAVSLYWARSASSQDLENEDDDSVASSSAAPKQIPRYAGDAALVEDDQIPRTENSMRDSSTDLSGNAEVDVGTTTTLPKGGVPVWGTHEVVCLSSSFASLTIVVDRRDPKRRVVALAREGLPYGRLRVDTKRPLCEGGETVKWAAALRFDGGGTRDATWTVVTAEVPGEPDGRYIYVRSNVGAPQQKGDETAMSYWLAGDGGALGVLASASKSGENQPGPSVEARCRWRAEAVPSMNSLGQRSNGPGGGGRAALTESGRTAELSPAEVAHFVEHGYVVCRAAAARGAVEEALGYLNGRLGRGDGRGKREVPSEAVSKLGGDAANAPETVSRAHTGSCTQ